MTPLHFNSLLFVFVASRIRTIYRNPRRSNVADVAALFAPRARRPEELAAAIADLADPDAPAMVRRVAGRLFDGTLDPVLERRSPLTAAGRNVLATLTHFLPELRDDLDLPALARSWEGSGHGRPEDVIRAVVAKLSLPHIAAEVTRDGRPVHLHPQDPRIFRPGPAREPTNLALGAI
jgi:hypothetical protein